MARPLEYSEDIIKKTEEYLDLCQDVEDEFHKTRGEKSDSYERVLRVKLPSIEGLALYLEVTRPTIYDWKTRFPEFSYIVDKLLAKQAELLINNGVGGLYNHSIAKLLLTKHGYVERNELTGKDGEKLELGVVILPKKDESTLETSTQTGDRA